MNKDVYGILGDLTAEILLEIIAECMDDYLYVFDLQNNKSVRTGITFLRRANMSRYRILRRCV